MLWILQNRVPFSETLLGFKGISNDCINLPTRNAEEPIISGKLLCLMPPKHLLCYASSLGPVLRTRAFGTSGLKFVSIRKYRKA